MTRSSTIDDAYSIRVTSHPAISATGERVAFILNGTDRAEGCAVTSLWEVESDRDPHQLTFETTDSVPQFLAKGETLSFRRTVGGATQVWVLPQGGQPNWCVRASWTPMPCGPRVQLRRIRHVLSDLSFPGGHHLFILLGPPSHRIDDRRRLVDWVTRSFMSTNGPPSRNLEGLFNSRIWRHRKRFGRVWRC